MLSSPHDIFTELECPDYPPGTNIDIAEYVGKTVGSEVNYLCPTAKFDNATKQPVKTIKCLKNLTWSDQGPNCVGRSYSQSTRMALYNIILALEYLRKENVYYSRCITSTY